MFIILHDFTFLNKNIYNTSNEIHHKSYMNRVNEVIPQVHLLFKAVNNVICPSKFIYDEYSKRIDNINFIIVNHTDYKCDMNRILVPKITNVINIGVFHIISEVKGSEYVSYLMKTYKVYRGLRINYLVVGVTIGKYREELFFELLKKYNIHGLLLLNKYGESWCYLLTKYLFSGLPILYNNIGSFKERITPLENRFSVGDTDGMIDIDRLNKGFEDMLNYIIVNGEKGKRVWTDGAELNKPDFLVQLFGYHRVSES
jgi:glycosyltransferase involved in cell wall biosynthesis